RHIWSAPRAVNSEKAQPGRRQSVKVAVSMRHQLVGFLGCRIKADRMIDIVMDRERQMRVAAIHRTRGRKNQMTGFAMPTTLEDVEKTGKIGIEISVRILQRITDAGLGGQMHHWPELAVCKDRLNGASLGEIDLVKGKITEFAQNRQARLLQRRIVIVIDAVHADHRATGFKQSAGKGKSDKARRAGNQDSILRHSRESCGC